MLKNFFLVTFCVNMDQQYNQDEVEVDLRDGIVRGYSEFVHFLQAPEISHGHQCDAPAVVKIDFSGLFKSARLSLEYDRPR